jgi:probable phosphoglycerate mutase
MSFDLRQRIAARRRIYLLRHGEVSYFDPQGRPFPPHAVPLNPKGVEQARAAARFLRDAPLDLAIHTGLPRTRETTEIALEGREVPIEVCEALREVTPGPFAKLPQGPEREAYFTGAFSEALAREARFLGGESYGEFEDRVLPAFDRIVATSGWKHLLLIAHGGTNRVILRHALGAGMESMGRIEQEAGCVNLIDVHDGSRLLVRQANYTPLSPLKLDVWATTLEQIYLDHFGSSGEA